MAFEEIQAEIEHREKSGYKNKLNEPSIKVEDLIKILEQNPGFGVTKIEYSENKILNIKLSPVK